MQAAYHKTLRLILIVVLMLTVAYHPVIILAGPTSNTYELKQYDFGVGGTDNSTSNTYSLFGIAGEQVGDPGTSNTYGLNGGLTYAIMANIPAVPTLSNPATNYDRLKFIINDGGNPTDTQFAIAISDDDFVTTRYIQNDNTVGTVLGSEDWQTYTNWGGASGEFVSSLRAGTTYKIKVKARQGNFTETPWSATSAGIATSDPSLTFGIDANSITFSNLNSGNSFTDTSKSTTITTSTNAYNGYIVYAHETQPLTNTQDAGQTIPDYPDPNSAPTTWAGTGFGYTTNDNDLSGGGGASRFTNGTKYAGFTTSAPGDPVADHTAVVENTAIVNEQFTISYRVTATNITTAGEYRNTVEYIVVPAY